MESSNNTDNNSISYPLLYPVAEVITNNNNTTNYYAVKLSNNEDNNNNITNNTINNGDESTNVSNESTNVGSDSTNVGCESTNVGDDSIIENSDISIQDNICNRIKNCFNETCYCIFLLLMLFISSVRLLQTFIELIIIFYSIDFSNTVITFIYIFILAIAIPYLLFCLIYICTSGRTKLSFLIMIIGMLFVSFIYYFSTAYNYLMNNLSNIELIIFINNFFVNIFSIFPIYYIIKKYSRVPYDINDNNFMIRNRYYRNRYRNNSSSSNESTDSDESTDSEGYINIYEYPNNE